MRRLHPLYFAVALPLAFTSGCGSDRPGALDNTVDVVISSGDSPSVTAFDSGPGPRSATPYPRYDLSFILPYGTAEQTFDIEVEPRASRLDVHLNIDTTGSFSGEIENLKSTIGSAVIPQLRSRVTDLAIGVSRFADFPVSPFGRNTDQPFNLLTPITIDFGRVSSAIFSLDMPLQNGGDGPEAWGEALWQIATGRGYPGIAPGDSRGAISPYFNTAGLDSPGGVGFRNGSARVVVNVTDAPSQEPFTYQSAVPNTHSTTEAANALVAVNARLIGIASGEPARPQLEAIAFATHATIVPTSGQCPTGVRGSPRAPVNGLCPLVFDILSNGEGLGAALVDAIVRFLDTLAFRAVNGTAIDDPHTFIRTIEAVSSRTTDGTPGPNREDRSPSAPGTPDGVLDTFVEVPTRTSLTFRVHLQNLSTPLQEYPQLFFVRMRLVGDGVIVGERIIRVIIPEGPKPPDAGDARTDAFLDAVLPDVALPDVTLPDVAISPITDAAVTDAAITDAAITDAAVTDAAITDAAVTDAAITDAAITDAAITDAAITDDPP